MNEYNEMDKTGRLMSRLEQVRQERMKLTEALRTVCREIAELEMREAVDDALGTPRMTS